MGEGSDCCAAKCEARKVFMRDMGLLFLRVSAGGLMLCTHGWGKLMSFSQTAPHFPDPIGLGSQVSLGLAVGAEVFCAAAVVLGIFTRLACIPLIVTMLVAALVIHADDPWAKKELAFMYLIPFVTIALTGGGKYTLGCWWCCRKKNCCDDKKACCDK